MQTFIVVITCQQGPAPRVMDNTKYDPRMSVRVVGGPAGLRYEISNLSGLGSRERTSPLVIQIRDWIVGYFQVRSFQGWVSLAHNETGSTACQGASVEILAYDFD